MMVYTKSNGMILAREATKLGHFYLIVLQEDDVLCNNTQDSVYRAGDTFVTVATDVESIKMTWREKLNKIFSTLIIS